MQNKLAFTIVDGQSFTQLVVVEITFLNEELLQNAFVLQIMPLAYFDGHSVTQN